MCNPIAVANEFLRLAGNNGQKLGSVKLQKLVFFAHGLNLAKFGEPLITGQFEAWDGGPVNLPLQAALGMYGIDEIHKLLPCKTKLKNKEQLKLVKRVWETFGKLKGFQLSNLTHLPGSPWCQARDNAKEGEMVPISDEIITAYFKGISGEGSGEKEK